MRMKKKILPIIFMTLMLCSCSIEASSSSEPSSSETPSSEVSSSEQPSSETPSSSEESSSSETPSSSEEPSSSEASSSEELSSEVTSSSEEPETSSEEPSPDTPSSEEQSSDEPSSEEPGTSSEEPSSSEPTQQTYTVTQTTFNSTSDYLNGDTNISFDSYKGGGTSDPVSKDGVIRLYQNASGTGGGYITISAKDGYSIVSATIGSGMSTVVRYWVDDSSSYSDDKEIAANAKLTVEPLDNSKISFQCMSTSKTGRLYVNYLSVTYVASEPGGGDIPPSSSEEPSSSETPSSEEPSSSEPSSNEPSGDLVPGIIEGNPVVNKEYRLGMEQENLGDTYFITGNYVNTYYGETTTDYDSAAKVKVTSTTGGYHIKVNNTYLNVVQKDSYRNIKFESTPTTVWEYDTTYKTFITDLNGTDCYVGTYNRFDTLSCSTIDHIKDSYPAHLYELVVNDNPSSSEPDDEPGDYPSTPDNYDGSYYDGINDNAAPNTVLGELRDLIVETHDVYTSYDDCGGGSSKLMKTDFDPENPSKILLFYSRKAVSNSSSNFNREHVWPKSTGLWNTSGGGSDMHHIRPTDSKINSTRGNLVFGEVSGGKTATGNNGEVGGYYGGGVFEPLDEVKGDVARIIMYMFVHYNSPSTLGSNTNKSGNCPTTASSKTSGNLPLTNVFNGSKTNAFNLLLEWHNDDPVDEIEINRNEAVYKIQGNRNPFIDKPDYANYIWG